MRYELNEIEEKKYNDWCQNHKCTIGYAGAIGGKTTVSFTSTSIGQAVSVKCACGAYENITDYDSW